MPNTVHVEIVDNRTIILYYPYSKQHIPKMKSMPRWRWIGEEKYWQFPYHENILHELEVYFKQFNYAIEIQHINTKDSSKKQKKTYSSDRKCPQEYIDKLEVMQYSKNTHKVYINSFTDFINYYAEKDLLQITKDDTEKFLLYLVKDRQISEAYQNQMINAIKFYYEKVLGQQKMPYINIDRPIMTHKLPNALSKEEIASIIKGLKNIKHKTMISLIYACGLRRSELINLKPANIDSKRNLLLILGAKGKKDRVIPLSKKIIEMLREYYKLYKPKVWLFEGQNAGEQYGVSSLNQVLKYSVKAAKINKPVSLHWLRHSCATHMHEAGIDIQRIQLFLGHASSKTTEIYTHISLKSMQNIKSPFDDLEL